MTNLATYHTANLPELMKVIRQNGIGMDDYLDRFFNSDFPQSNYPPYNLVQLNNHESKLEIESEIDGTFVHKGLAQRDFQRVWTITDDTKVGSVKFVDGLLTVELKKIVPEHHARKDYI